MLRCGVASTLPNCWKRLEKGVPFLDSHWDAELGVVRRMGDATAAHMYYAQRQQSKLKSRTREALMQRNQNAYLSSLPSSCGMYRSNRQSTCRRKLISAIFTSFARFTHGGLQPCTILGAVSAGPLPSNFGQLGFDFQPPKREGGIKAAATES